MSNYISREAASADECKHKIKHHSPELSWKEYLKSRVTTSGTLTQRTENATLGLAHTALIMCLIGLQRNSRSQNPAQTWSRCGMGSGYTQK